MFKIVKKVQFSEKVFRLDVEAPLIAKARKAGHFVIVRVDEKGERVPLTIAGSDKEKGTIEVIPLAYMRGRTLDEAFIILDEAQNTTDKQMLMFLTRLGFNSKMVVNGDITQIDLNINRTRSGLKIASEKLQDIPGIGFIEFTNSDVVRNPLVQKIIEKFNIE